MTSLKTLLRQRRSSKIGGAGSIPTKNPPRFIWSASLPPTKHIGRHTTGRKGDVPLSRKTTGDNRQPASVRFL